MSAGLREETRSVAASVGAEPPVGGMAAKIALAIVAIGWVGVLTLVLRHSIFVSHDSISNYGHVWYVQERIWHGHPLPFRMPVVGHGAAFAFPYGFIPWFTAALLWPLLGNWIVTLWLVLGTVALIVTTYWAFPELRRGWWSAAVLVNPALVLAPIYGELPFIWAAAMLMGAVACWRRKRYWPAAVLAGLGQATHPAVVLPMAALLVACWWHWETDRPSLLRYYAASLVIVIPAVWLVFASPVFSDSSTAVIMTNLVATLAGRGLILLVPIALVVLKRHGQLLQKPAHLASWLPSACFAALLGLNIVLMGPLDVPYAWGALQRRANTEVLTFIRSPKFVPGATYRILRNDFRIGMYQLEQHGAKLDSEFFPESIARQSWPSLTKYSAFLRKRRVDFVIIFANYDRQWRTNEHTLLRDLTKRGPNGCGSDLVGVRRIEAAPDFDVYEILRTC